MEGAGRLVTVFDARWLWRIRLEAPAGTTESQQWQNPQRQAFHSGRYDFNRLISSFPVSVAFSLVSIGYLQR